MARLLRCPIPVFPRRSSTTSFLPHLHPHRIAFSSFHAGAEAPSLQPISSHFASPAPLRDSFPPSLPVQHLGSPLHLYLPCLTCSVARSLLRCNTTSYPPHHHPTSLRLLRRPTFSSYLVGAMTPPLQPVSSTSPRLPRRPSAILPSHHRSTPLHPISPSPLS